MFGDNVEEWLGRWRFLLLLVCATLIGDAAHIIGDPRSTIPCIGASGGISGIVAFYALKFPIGGAGVGCIFWLLTRQEDMGTKLVSTAAGGGAESARGRAQST